MIVTTELTLHASDEMIKSRVNSELWNLERLKVHDLRLIEVVHYHITHTDGQTYSHREQTP